MPHKQKIPVEEKVKIVQDCPSNRISTSDAELLDRHLEANEELRLFFEKHPDKKKDYVFKKIDSGPIEDFLPEGIE